MVTGPSQELELTLIGETILRVFPMKRLQLVGGTCEVFVVLILAVSSLLW